MNPTQTILAIMTILASATSYANLDIRFIEGAPKDSFVINNTSACEITEFTVDIDLTSSAGKLIFDTRSMGAGVEVYQPFEVRSGELMLISEKRVSDGNDKLSIQIMRLAPNESASFTIDVDDRLSNSELGQIRVSNAEIQGAIARINLGDDVSAEGIFNNQSYSSIPLPNCA